MRLHTIFYFISFYNAVICCNPDWFPYGTKCYRGIQFDYDVRLARRYCQIFRGDLAVISDNSTLQSIAPILFENSNEVSYWVHENSTFGDTTSSSSCSYIYSDESLSVKLGTDGNCDNGKQFVCEVSKMDNDYICPTSWTYYGNICYKTFKNLATYEQAASYCSLQRSQLAVLDDISKEHNAAAVIIGRKDVYLVAAKKDGTNETLKWSSGNNFHPSCFECISNNGSQGECIGFSSDQQHPTMFTWVPLNCSSSNYYMCEMQPVLRSTTPFTTEPTTTLKPLQCPVGYNWKAHEASGFCYWETTYETNRLNWYQARQFCQKYGGDLATYDNTFQEEHGLGGAKGHYRGLWFGLKRGKDNVMHWVDNVTRSYNNWYGNEPDFDSPSKFCVKHGERNSKWELDYCGVRRWFICKAPKTREPKFPDVDSVSKKIHCNFSGPSVYRNQWYLFDNHCYLVREAPKYSWDTAQYFCQVNGGHLASIHSFEETDFILQLMPNTINTDFWTGLSARGFDSSLTWSDGAPLEFTYWEDNFNNTILIDKCVTFDKQKGSWKTEHCNRFLGLICKRGVNASYDFTTPEPTPLLPGHCEKGWYQLGNKCYKPFGEKWSKREMWNNAKKKCEEQDATLASIHSADEQDYLTDILLDVGAHMWIGLENIDKGTIFKWADDSALDFTDWNTNQPVFLGDDKNADGSYSRLCVTMDFESNNMGKWSDNPCHRRNPYVCQKSTSPLLTEPSDDPFVCTNISGWSRLGSTCFGVFEDEELPWVKAQATCRTYGANLVKMSFAGGIFLKRKIKKKNKFFWIGTRETKENQYESVQKGGDIFTNWLSGQPRRRTDYGNCVSMNNQSKWIVQDCKEKLPFVCALSLEKPLEKEEDTLPEVRHTFSCPDNTWDRIDNRCYYMPVEDATWSNAMMICHRKGGSLASFHSLKEVDGVREYIRNQHTRTWRLHYSIGLTKLFDGSYGWVDHSPVDFTYWEYDASTINPETNRKCAVMLRNSGKWMVFDCDQESRPYICSFTPKVNHKTTDLLNTTEMNSEAMGYKQTEDVSTGLSAGGIAGIVIFVLLVLLAVIGSAIYHYYPTRTVSPTLLEQDNL